LLQKFKIDLTMGILLMFVPLQRAALSLDLTRVPEMVDDLSLKFDLPFAEDHP
jgi:hypothetical protein